MGNYNDELTDASPRPAWKSLAVMRWKCPRPECEESFQSELEMARHQYKKCHWRCLSCRMDFADRDALASHNAQTHPQPQELMCPGCGAEFISAGGFMQHIERRDCVVINPEHLHERRKKETEFHEALRKMNPANDDLVLTGGMGKLAFNDKHRPFAQPDQHIPDYRYTTTYPTDDQDLPGYRTGYAKVPDLLTGEDQKKPTNTAEEGAKAEEKKLFPLAADDPPRPQGRKLEIYTRDEPDPSVGAANANQRIIDPDAPGFNAAVFYHSILETFKCPHPRCNSSFPKARSLIAHLRSPAHQPGVEFTCPACLRHFTGMQAAIQHAETASRTCKINQTEDFRKFIHHVTGGMMDALNSKEECLTDGRPRFIVPKKFVESFPIPLRFVRVRPELEKLGSGRMADWDDDKSDFYDNLRNKELSTPGRRNSEAKTRQTTRGEPQNGW